MEFKTFFQTINKQCKLSTSPERTAYDLYCYIGASPSESTTEAYYKGRRPPRINRGEIYEPGFFRFFEERTHTTWRDIQAEFAKLSEPTIIDLDCGDEHKFYQSLLAEFYEIVRSGPISLCHYLHTAPLLWGRKKEIYKVTSLILEQKIIVLTGIGGIGKSQVALACAHHLCATNHMICQHIFCEETDTIRTAIIKLQFDDPSKMAALRNERDQKQFLQRMQFLKNQSHSILIILDNFDREFTVQDRNDLSQLLSCGSHIHVLITSRNTKPRDGLPSIRILPLDDQSLLEVYAYHSIEDEGARDEYIKAHRDQLLKMFSIFDRHTLAIVLLAKLARRSFMSPAEICELISQGFPLPDETVSLQKDRKYSEASAINVIRKIFDTTQLESRDKNTLSYMSIMPFCGVDLKVFESLTGCKRQSILLLRDQGWITVNDSTLRISLHPLICEAVLSYDDLIPTDTLCQRIMNSIEFSKSTLSKARDSLKIAETAAKNASEEATAEAKVAIERAAENVAIASANYYALQPIGAAILSRIHFRKIVSYAPSGHSLFEHLKDEYKEPLLTINKRLTSKANTQNTPDK